MIKKFLFAFVVIILAAGCNITQSTDVDVDASTRPLSQGGVPDGDTNGTCKDVDRVVISAHPSQLVVGQQERIDVTPKDKDGKPRDPDCDEATGVNWDSNEEICTVGDDEAFVTFIKGIKAGTCTIRAIVAGKDDTESFPVN